MCFLERAVDGERSPSPLPDYWFERTLSFLTFNFSKVSVVLTFHVLRPSLLWRPDGHPTNGLSSHRQYNDYTFSLLNYFHFSNRVCCAVSFISFCLHWTMFGGDFHSWHFGSCLFYCEDLLASHFSHVCLQNVIYVRVNTFMVLQVSFLLPCAIKTSILTSYQDC